MYRMRDLSRLFPLNRAGLHVADRQAAAVHYGCGISKMSQKKRSAAVANSCFNPGLFKEFERTALSQFRRILYHFAHLFHREGDMKLSIAAYSFHGLREVGMMDVFGYLETVKYRYRLEAADIWNGIVGSEDFIHQKGFLEKVKEAIDEREMTVVNYHVDGCHIWEDDPAARERNYNAAIKHLKAAKVLGARSVRIDAGGKGKAWTSEQFDHIVERFKEYSQIAKQYGFRTGPENHWGPQTIPDNMERLAHAVDDPGFGILLHLGHWEDSDEEEGDRRLSRWAFHTHIDARVARTRLESAMRLLLDAGYQGHWGVELLSGANEYAEVGSQLAQMRLVIEKYRQDSRNGSTYAVPH
jgi:sugar phosphate isomerase/epimerase